MDVTDSAERSFLQGREDEILAFLAHWGFSPPGDWALYHKALTHSSYTYEQKRPAHENYERLEFLGDAVLKLVVSEYLYERFPDYREGELTKIRAVVVSDANVALLAKHLDLGRQMRFGVSEARNGGAKKTSNIACGFEALLGALFLDGKMAEIRTFLRRIMEDVITEVDLDKSKNNYKAVLQEFTQGEGYGLPTYETISESGPSHNRVFYVEVSVNNEVMGHGRGKTKKEAQQSAAKMALDTLNYVAE